MDEKYDWEMARKNALDALGRLQSEDRGDIYRYLLEASAIIADIVCKKEQRFSILELISISGAGCDAYKIVFANPLESSDSPRHGASEVGMLREPREKLALLEAIREQKVIIANNVAENPLTQYLGAHVERKKLQHMVVMPCRGYLLLFDRVACSEPFQEEETHFLNQALRIVNYGFRWYSKDRHEYGISDVLRGIISHRVKNPVMIIGGFHERLEEALKQGDYERALSYTEIISQAGGRLAKDLELFKEAKDLLLDSRDKEKKIIRKLSEYLKVFRRDAFQLDKNLFREELVVNNSEKITRQLFSRIKNFMLGNRRDHDLDISLLSSDNGIISVKFVCSGFRKVKGAIDENLFFIRWIAEMLGGKTEVGDDYLIVELPRA